MSFTITLALSSLIIPLSSLFISLILLDCSSVAEESLTCFMSLVNSFFSFNSSMTFDLLSSDKPKGFT